MKLTGALCQGQCQQWYIINSTSEKFRESAIYEQTGGGCYAGVNPLKAHPGASLETWKPVD